MLFGKRMTPIIRASNHAPKREPRSNGSEPVCFDPFCALIGWRSFDFCTLMKLPAGRYTLTFIYLGHTTHFAGCGQM